MRKITWGAVLIAVVAGGYWFLAFAGRPEISLVLPERGTAVRAVYATGVVEPEYWAAVAPLEGGRIVAILAAENTAVAKDEPLAQLDDQEAGAVIAELVARRDFLAREIERNRKLLSRSIVSEKVYDQVQSEHREIMAAIAGAKVRRDHMTLRAPIDGHVLRQDGEVGEVVERGQPVFWVGAPRPLRIEAEVDEEDIPAVRVGQAVKIKADAFPERSLDGRVDEITPKGDPINKSYRVHIALPDDTPLMIGMTAETNIVIEERGDALLVPTTAIRGGSVFSVEDDRARAIPVETGVSGHLSTEIISGLDDSQRIINDPPSGLRDGARVRTVNDED